MSAALVSNLRKTIDGKQILEDLSLEIREHEIFGILGPNGAGKTSLLRCLTGLWTPLGGSVEILGLDRRDDDLDIRKSTFFLADQPFVEGNRTGRDHLELIAQIYAVPVDLAKHQIESLARAFELADVLDDMTCGYSNGQRKKLAIAGALVSNARLLILDEPFTGEIDPPGVATVKMILRKLTSSQKISCILTTQITPLAAEICDRIALVHGGKVRAVGTVPEITAAFGYEPHELERVLCEMSGKQGQAAGLDFIDSVRA